MLILELEHVKKSIGGDSPTWNWLSHANHTKISFLGYQILTHCINWVMFVNATMKIVITNFQINAIYKTSCIWTPLLLKEFKSC
jgi:hypothetical protein